MLHNVRTQVERWLSDDRRALLEGALVAVLTYLACHAGAGIIVEPQKIAPFWPPAGIGVGAALAVDGRRRRFCLLGALLGILAFNLSQGRGPGAIATYVGAHALEFGLLTVLTGRWIATPLRLDSLRNVLLWLVATALSVLAAGFVVAVGFTVFDYSSASISGIWSSWFASHIIGIVVVAPVFLTLAAERPGSGRLGREDAEGAVVLAVTLFAAILVLSHSVDGGGVLARTAPLALFFPLLLWAAVRCRPVCAAGAAVVVGWFTMAGVVTGQGPFAGTGRLQGDGIAAAQVFIFSTVLCAQVLSALIQDQRRSRLALRHAKEHFELALAAGNTGTWSLDLQTQLIEADSRARDIWGFDATAVITDALIDSRVHPQDRVLRRRRLREAQDPAGSGRLEIDYRLSAHGDRPERWVVVRGKAEFADERTNRLFGTIRDITTRKLSETVLARDRNALEATVLERTTQLQSMLEGAVSAILTIDSQGTIQSVNPATTRLFGYASDELVGNNVRMLMPEPDAGNHDGYLSRYLQTGTRTIIGRGREVQGLRKSGEAFPIHLAVSEFRSGGRTHFTGIITDLTEHKAAQDALRETERRLSQAQKMEAIGQLTGGIAHDFNNLLTVISGNLELLEMRLEDAMAQDFLHRAQDAVRKGARLTEQLSTFSRRRALQPIMLDLNETAIGMTELMRRALGENVTVANDLAPGLWLTRADPSEIENAILNLAINARDAMPGGGRILIETDNTVLAAADAAGMPDARPGEYVRLSVIDTGVGMTPEIAARALEPFFTTKDSGKGTGLGLSTIYGFVHQSGGYMTIDSRLGHGTRVSIYLPRDTTGAQVSLRPQTGTAAAALEGEVVLVVEDNADVRDLALRHLDQLGYRTLEATDGPSAMAVLQGTARVDLLFSDVVMPGGMSGFELARRARQVRPGLAVLLTSGFAPRDVEAHEGSAAGDHEQGPAPPLIRKPYSRVELARAVRQALST